MSTGQQGNFSYLLHHSIDSLNSWRMLFADDFVGISDSMENVQKIII